MYLQNNPAQLSQTRAKREVVHRTGTEQLLSICKYAARATLFHGMAKLHMGIPMNLPMSPFLGAFLGP